MNDERVTSASTPRPSRAIGGGFSQMVEGAVAMAALAVTCLVAMGCAWHGGSDPGESAEEKTSALAATGAAVDPNLTLGFDAVSGWTASGTLASAPNRTQGSGALKLTNPANETDLTSVAVASTAKALSGLRDPNSSFALDLTLPEPPRNPNNPGSAQLFISCPSRGLKNVNLGQVAFSGLRRGIYNTVKFSIPDNVRKALGSATYSDLVFNLKLHTPGNPNGAVPSYLFDNLRVHSPSAPPPASQNQSAELVALLRYAPAASTPGVAHFPVGVVQVPQSFHVKLGNAGSGSVALDIGFDDAAQATCTYGATADGAGYAFTSCSNGSQPGDLLGGNFSRLTILGGDSSAGTTKVRATLALNPAGDSAGAGVIPPMPTFWGDDPAASNQIIGNYFAAANATPPTEELWIHAPVPEFAKRTGDPSPHDNLTGPPPPNDPPFDQEGHMNPGNSHWDAYWRLAGSLSYDDSTNARTLHFDSDLSAHAVLWGKDFTVVQFRSTVDTNSGDIQAGGLTGASANGTAHGYIFGSEIEGGSDNLSDFNQVYINSSISYDAPPIEIWIFSITVGVNGGVGLDYLHYPQNQTSSISSTGFDIGNWEPYAAIGVHLEGGVNLGIASGGVSANIDLIKISTPVQARASWAIDTSRVCTSTLSYALHGQAKLSTLGGHVDLVATLGICPFCLHADQPIIAWDGIDLGSQRLFDESSDGAPKALPTADCAFNVGGCDCGNAPDGSCNTLPPGYAGSCGCNGIVQCNGSCLESPPPGYGDDCACGGKIQCDGSCGGLPPGYGQPCGCAGGTTQCDGSCNNTPTEVGVASLNGDACCGTLGGQDKLVFKGACPNGLPRGSCSVTSFTSSDTNRSDCGANWVSDDPYDCTCNMHFASSLGTSVHCTVAVTEQSCN